jgi:hypothetical protein
MRQIKTSASQKNAVLSRMIMVGGSSHTPRHLDDRISLILDEGIAFTGDLPVQAWGVDPMRQVEMSWRRK